MEEEKLGNLEEEIFEVVHRFEEMKRKDASYFFDVAEFETIIDYYLEQNDVSFAFDAAEAASKQHPGSVSLQLRKAKVFIDKGRAMEALKLVKVLENIEPGNFEVYIIKGAALGMLGDNQGTRKNFDLALAVDPDDEVNILLSISSILHNLNQYDLLVEYLQRLIELEPYIYTHIYDMAYAFEKLNDYRKSIEYYKKFLDNDPFSDSAWYNLGILYNKTDNNVKALECYEYALAVNPDNFFALFNKGNILSNSGDYTRALEAYLEYLEFEDESSEALTYAGECYHKMGDKNIAIKFYRQAIEYDPEFAEPWFGLGMVEMDMGRTGRSIQHFKRAVEFDSENPEYWHFLGKAYFADGKIMDSVRSFIEALRLDPFYDSAWSDAGHLIVAVKAYTHIYRLLEHSIRITGDVYGLRFILASVYLYNGNNERCRMHLKKAFSSSSDAFTRFSELFPDDLIDEETRLLIRTNQK